MDRTAFVELLLGAPVDLLVAVVAASLIYLAVIAATRLVGLRSFAKLSAFDFAMTVAVGSVIAGVGTGAATLPVGVVIIVVLFGMQYLIALLRRRTGVVHRVLDNTPLLLMHGERVLDDHLAQARLTRDDLVAKLRGANVHRIADVRAVVFETTGDVSVLHGPGDLDPAIFSGVRCGEVDPTAPPR